MEKVGDVHKLCFFDQPVLRKTRFTENIIRENVLKGHDFKEWVFHRGMLFEALDKWWGDGGRRDKPHEGLDLCLYRDRQDSVFCLDAQTKIPVMYNGVVVSIINDFLGKSILIEHRLPNNDAGRFFTIYGHTNPHEDIHVDTAVKQGTIIATLAGSTKSRAGIMSHLHISIGRLSKAASYEKLDWEKMGTPDTVIFDDPIQALDWHYLKFEEEERIHSKHENHREPFRSHSEQRR